MLVKEYGIHSNRCVSLAQHSHIYTISVHVCCVVANLEFKPTQHHPYVSWFRSNSTNNKVISSENDQVTCVSWIHSPVTSVTYGHINPIGSHWFPCNVSPVGPWSRVPGDPSQVPGWSIQAAWDPHRGPALGPDSLLGR